MTFVHGSIRSYRPGQIVFSPPQFWRNGACSLRPPADSDRGSYSLSVFVRKHHDAILSVCCGISSEQLWQQSWPLQLACAPRSACAGCFCAGDGEEWQEARSRRASEREL